MEQDVFVKTSETLRRTRDCLQRSRSLVAMSSELIGRTFNLIRESQGVLVRTDDFVISLGPLRRTGIPTPEKP